ncbi:MAG TPA: apolipoprotein N-acyltransferase [Opitutaceae bacterium]|nr:apolipoprotein N-acyltransferase [Opitutaceae bacterium]
MTPDPYDPVPTIWERHSELIVPIVCGVLTVILLAISFPPHHAPECAYAFLVPGILWAYRRPKLKVYAWTLFMAQAVGWTINVYWLHPVTWFGMFAIGTTVGAWTGSWYLLAWWAMPRMMGKPTPVRLVSMTGLAGAWVVIEWTRTWFLGGFPWMPLAATQWERIGILQIAAYTGAYGVSFVIVCVNVAFAAYVNKLFHEGATGLGRRSQEFLFAMFLLLACLCVLVQETTHRSLYTVPFATVAFVQPKIPATVKWDPAKAPEIMQTLHSLTLGVGDLNPDLILWPESTTPYPLKGGDPAMQRFVSSIAARTRAPMLVGADAIEHGADGKDTYYNAAFVIDPQLGVQSSYYAKRKLVQFGEYVPMRSVLGWIGKFAPLGDDDFTPGTDSSPLVVPMSKGSAAFGVLICYEDLFPGLARDEVRSGADALVVVTNDAWYGEGQAAYQHAANSVLRAIETRRPVLRCGNAGWSGWIDEFGNVRRWLHDEDGSVYIRGTFTAKVTRDQRWIGRNSFYVEHGDWFVLVSAALLALTVSLLGVSGITPLPVVPKP